MLDSSVLFLIEIFFLSSFLFCCFLFVYFFLTAARNLLSGGKHKWILSLCICFFLPFFLRFAFQFRKLQLILGMGKHKFYYNIKLSNLFFPSDICLFHKTKVDFIQIQPMTVWFITDMWESKWVFSEISKSIQLLTTCFLPNKLSSSVSVGEGKKKKPRCWSFSFLCGLVFFTTFQKGCDFFLLLPLVYVLFWFWRMDEGYRGI